MNKLQSHHDTKSDEKDVYDETTMINQNRLKDRKFLETQPNIITGTNHEVVQNGERKMVPDDKILSANEVKQIHEDEPSIPDSSALSHFRNVPHVLTELSRLHQRQQRQQRQQEQTQQCPQRQLISKYPLLHSYWPNDDIPRSLNPVFNRVWSDPLSTEQFNQVAQINGKVLTRDPETHQFKWHSPTILQPSSYFTASLDNPVLEQQQQQQQQQQQVQLQQQPEVPMPQMDEFDYHRLHKNFCKNQLFPELLTSPQIVLNSASLSATEKCFETMRANWFKTMRVVCDSYANFICPEVKCYQSPLCARSGAEMTISNFHAQKQPQQWKSWVLTPEIVENSIYPGAIEALYPASNPTPLTLFLRHDYRAQRWCNNDTIVHLVDLLNWVKSKYLVSIVKTSKNIALVNRVKSYFSGNMMSFAAFCPHYNGAQQQQQQQQQCPVQTNTKLNGKKQRNQQAIAETTPEREHISKPITKEILECIYKQLTTTPDSKTFYSLSSLSPTSRWLSFVWCAQQLNKLNNPNNDNYWDIRTKKEKFANDISSPLKKINAFVSHSPDHDWDQAYKHHTTVCSRLSKRKRDAALLKNTTVQFRSYFSNPSFVHHLQQFVKNQNIVLNTLNPTMFKLNALPELVAAFADYRENARLSNAISSIRNRKALKDIATHKYNIEDSYRYDKKERKCSKIVSPRALQACKAQLRHTYTNTNWLDNIFLTDLNLGRVVESNPNAPAGIGTRIAKFFSKLKRKLSH